VFKIRRSLFLIAAKDPDVFFKNNTYYRFLEKILNSTLSYTEDFSILTVFLDRILRKKYSKNIQTELFDFASIKENYLEKVKSNEIRREVSNLINDFEMYFVLFLFTRTIIDLIVWFIVIAIIAIYSLILSIFKKISIKDMIMQKSVEPTAKRVMNNSQFAYVAQEY
jgi:hypothetical protein